ncbi:MAG: hypothetical protein C5B58_10965 [Acidobacteria bacterium]|nr:MAG: hypothetical protein C5B58_10965 [Acidobacteriota bacterium]
MTEADIQRGIASDPDNPEMTDADWAAAVLVVPLGKESIHLRVDRDVLEWFRSQGGGHLTRMNAVLRAYYEAKRSGGKGVPSGGAAVEARRPQS